MPRRCSDRVACGAVTATCQRCLQLHFPKRCARMAAAARVTPKSGIGALETFSVCPLSRSLGLCFNECTWKLCLLPVLEKSGGAPSAQKALPVALKSTILCCRFKPRAQQAATKEEKLGGKTGATLGLFLLPCPLISAVSGLGQGAVISPSRSLGSSSRAAFCP